jgi:hypothetical protein
VKHQALGWCLKTSTCQVDNGTGTNVVGVGLVKMQHDGWHMWSRNCLPFRSTWVHPRFLVGFVLRNL